MRYGMVWKVHGPSIVCTNDQPTDRWTTRPPAVSQRRKRGTLVSMTVIQSVIVLWWWYIHIYVCFRRAFTWNTAATKQRNTQNDIVKYIRWHGLYIHFERRKFRCYIPWQFYLANVKRKTVAFFARDHSLFVLKTKINTFSLCKTQKSHVNTHTIGTDPWVNVVLCYNILNTICQQHREKEYTACIGLKREKSSFSLGSKECDTFNDMATK